MMMEGDTFHSRSAPFDYRIQERLKGDDTEMNGRHDLRRDREKGEGGGGRNGRTV